MRIIIYFLCTCLLRINTSEAAINLTDFTDSCKKHYKFHIDPNLGLLKINPPEKNELSCAEKIRLLSISTPLRILWDKDYLSITPPIFRNKSEPQRFEAVIIGQHNEHLMRKLHRMGNWFLRNRIYWKQKGRFIEIQLSCKKEFFLNQFYSDFQEFSQWIFPDEKRIEFTISEKDWLNFQRDLLFENFTGHQPDYNPENSETFRRQNRRGVLSDVP